MNGHDGRSLGALDELKAEFERAARRARRRNRRWLSLASSGSIALVAACLTFTAPGAALAAMVTEALGIGSRQSLPPAQRGALEHRQRGVVIAAGTTPDGDSFEVVASYAKQAKPMDRLPAGEEFTCLTVDFVDYPDEESSEICLDEDDVRNHYAGAEVIDGVQPGDRYFRAAGAARDLGRGRYYLYGLVGTGVERVEVAYTDDEGRSQTVDAELGWIDRGIAAELGLERWASGVGMMIAFLPDDGLPPLKLGRDGPLRQQPGHPGTSVITGFDADSTEVARHDLGGLYSRSLTAVRRSLRVRMALRKQMKGLAAEKPKRATRLSHRPLK